MTRFRKVINFCLFFVLFFIFTFSFGCGKSGQNFSSTLLPNCTWYKGRTEKKDIQNIKIVKNYNLDQVATEFWNADTNNNGSIKCYVLANKTLIISANSNGIIYANEDSRGLFSGNEENLFFINLEKIEGLELIDTSKVKTFDYAFNKCHKLSGELDLSSWDMSNVTSTKAMFQYAGEYGENILDVKLPSSLKVYSDFMFNHNQSYAKESFTIGLNVQHIGYMHMWYNLGTKVEKTSNGYEYIKNQSFISGNPLFNKFIVEDNNQYFSAEDGILYDKNKERLISIPAGKIFDNYTFNIPEGIKFLNELSFSRTKNIHTLILPNSYEIIVDFNSNLYPDKTINNGNSLNVAVYKYTTIKNYEVKQDNSKYVSYNGCIYSKDSENLIAIPSSYAGYNDNQILQIKEGTKKIVKNAFFNEVFINNPEISEFGLKITKIIIPKSIIEIDSEQLSLLNNLISQGIEIEIDKNNSSFEIVDKKIIKKEIIWA